MKSIVVVLIVVFFVTNASALVWRTCCSGCAFTPQSATLTPAIPRAGDTADVTITGQLASDVNGGTVDTTISIKIFIWINVMSFTNDTCDIVTCPLKAGAVDIPYQLTVPDDIVSGLYKAKAQFNENGEIVACVELEFNMEALDDPRIINDGGKAINNVQKFKL